MPVKLIFYSSSFQVQHHRFTEPHAGTLHHSSPSQNTRPELLLVAPVPPVVAAATKCLAPKRLVRLAIIKHQT
ncbi:hypothetical protein ACOSQ2_010977 [Xanthoceras sorbifolium]